MMMRINDGFAYGEDSENRSNDKHAESKLGGRVRRKALGRCAFLHKNRNRQRRTRNFITVGMSFMGLSVEQVIQFADQ